MPVTTLSRGNTDDQFDVTLVTCLLIFKPNYLVSLLNDSLYFDQLREGKSSGCSNPVKSLSRDF